jgi:GT2 family glycosyltransferase
MKSKNKVAIVLVNYKAYANSYLEDCYKSLLKQTDKDFDIFIADNQTSKDSVKTIKKLAPKAKMIENPKNLGWAGGNNSIIKPNLNKYDYFIMLNMDTVLDENWLKELVDYADRNDESIVQSKILIYQKNKINSLGNRIQYLGFGFCNGYGKDKAFSVENGNYQIDYASGAGMLIKKKVFEKIGLFREEFFMYHDDLEFCWRARLAGFKIGIAEKSILEHKYSFGSTMNLIYYMERNRLVALFSLEKIPSILLILPILMPFELTMLIYMGLKGNFMAKLRALFYPLTPTGYGLILKIRKEVNTYRVVNDSEAIKNFAGKIEFTEIKNPVLNLFANPILDIYWKIVRTLIVW